MEEVKARLDGGEGLALVDVREDREWVTAHATGAIHVGKGVIERDIEKAVPDPAPLSYCTAAAVPAPPWPRSPCSAWATPRSSP